MRLRVRDASSGQTWRVQLEQISPTFEDLDVLHSDPTAALNSLGLCNGDLVWILSPVPCTDPLAVQPPAATTTPMVPEAVEPMVVSHQQVKEGEEENPMDIDPEEDSESYHSVPFPVPVGLRIPGYLLRVLTSNSTSSSSSTTATTTMAMAHPGFSFLEKGPPGILLLMAHASMLETGFTYSNNNYGSTNEGEKPENSEQYKLSLSSTAISPGVYRQQYSLPTTMETMQAVSTTPACTLICSAMGDSVLIAAAAHDGKHSRHVVLDWKAQGYVVAYSTTKNEDASLIKLSECVEITPRQDIILLQSTLENKNNTRGGEEAKDDDEHCCHHQQYWMLEHDSLRKVWNILKDSIALPMLTAACLSAGYPPPAGLLTLPTEVKNSLLCFLGALDLAALGCTSTELRHLTSSDELWKPLFLADFPSPPVEIADAALKKGYKWAYAHCFIERRRVDEERQRRRHRRYVIPGLPHLGPRPPYYPAPAPRGFPGIIGGDQDRLPFFPGPPGRFTFGGGGGGSHPRWI